MPNLLFVCNANQFRSPLCAALFKAELAQRGIIHGWQIESAGNWVPRKSGAHPAAIHAANRLGLDLRNHEAREITGSMIEAADRVIVMTADQREALQVEFTDQQGKIFLLKELSDGIVSDVADPASSNFTDADRIAAELHDEIKKLAVNLIDKISVETNI